MWYYSQDILFDNVNRAGLIQARLRLLHKNLKTNDASPSKKRVPTDTGGPNPKSGRTGTEDESYDEGIQTTIDELNRLSPKEGKQGIMRLMAETFTHRNHLRSTNNLSIINLYRKFTECDYLVSEISFNCI